MLIESFHFNANVPAPLRKSKEQYILANGDLTGYGLHADFQNGTYCFYTDLCAELSKRPRQAGIKTSCKGLSTTASTPVL